MSRKGISPLIAAVLLIAFTMAVASLFAQWAPQLIQEAQGDTTNRSGEIRSCSEIVLEVINGDNVTATFQQVGGQKAAGDVSVTWFYNDADPLQNVTTISSNRGTVKVNVTEGTGYTFSDVGNSLSEIRVQPTSCEGAATTTYP